MDSGGGALDNRNMADSPERKIFAWADLGLGYSIRVEIIPPGLIVDGPGGHSFVYCQLRNGICALIQTDALKNDV